MINKKKNRTGRGTVRFLCQRVLEVTAVKNMRSGDAYTLKPPASRLIAFIALLSR